MRIPNRNPEAKQRRIIVKGSCLFACMAALGLTLFLGVGTASASKQIVDLIGAANREGALGGQFVEPQGVAVNNSGTGPANQGDLYVADSGNNRIQRFGRDDHGTPGDTSDDTHFFISTWGVGVDPDAPGAAGYQICTVAEQCQAGKASGAAGGFDSVSRYRSGRALAVDQDTGEVYVSDGANYRISVFEGDGVFLRTFGFDVVESGPNDNGSGYEICVPADGDACKAGLPGSAAGQAKDTGNLQAQPGIAVSQPDSDPTSGSVFVADPGNNRVNTYNLDGTSPSSFTSSAVFPMEAAEPKTIAVDSRGIVYLSNRIGDGGFRIERYDSENANGQGVGFLAPITAEVGEVDDGLAIDPDSDGPGPDVDILYLLDNSNGRGPIKQFGPVNLPGITVPPSAIDEEHGNSPLLPAGGIVGSLAIDTEAGRLYTSNYFNPAAGSPDNGIYVLDNAGPPPSASLDSLSGITATSVVANATINPNGPPALSYHLEYSANGIDWKSTRDVLLGTQEAPQPLNLPLQPAGGLEPSTEYHVRLFAQRRYASPIVTPELTFTTLAAPPIAETVGSPLRTATTMSLAGRISPRNTVTTYHFEYGSQGPCDANPCASTEAREAGAGDETRLVAQRLEGLAPGTTYHYRVVADNGNPGSPVFGEDTTLTLKTGEVPLSHGRFFGPAGSDRAWEQINMADTGGNPVTFSATQFSADGKRALFRLSGGNPTSETGSLLGLFFSERTLSGWQVRPITPPRSELRGGDWQQTATTTDLASIVSANTDYTTGEAGIWRLGANSAPSKLFQRLPNQEYASVLGLSADGSRAIAMFGGEVDPAFPGATADNLYDVSSGAPRLASVLPSGGFCPTGINGEANVFPPQPSNWVSTDGSRMFFNCNNSLFVRDLVAEETEVLNPSLGGGDVCKGIKFAKSIPGAAFFTAGCDEGANVFRYDYGADESTCLTCQIANDEVDVARTIGVSNDGSTLYFMSESRLLPGAAEAGLYRLDVGSGDLAYVTQGNTQTIQAPEITPDGSVLIFDSKLPALNPVGGQSNGGTVQAYRYNDRDRSLVCISCVSDGSPPRGEALVGAYFGRATPAVSSDGNTIAFVTPTALSGADQNTAGPGGNPREGVDVYEWRDGRQILVTDGLTNWAIQPAQASVPQVSGVSPSGRDIYVLAAAQYTPDAIDAYQRLYDARIGGGFEFPKPPPPCPLEVCQGTPKGAHEESPPGSAAFSGPANPKAVAKQKKKRKHHAMKKHRKTKGSKHKAKQRANQDRRTAR